MLRVSSKLVRVEHFHAIAINTNNAFTTQISIISNHFENSLYL